jgi:ATP-dependent Clp protease ATP-binding subunit ClpA
MQRFDKFTERAKRVFSLAEEEARRFDHSYIGAEHLLLGLVREGGGIAAKVLSSLGVDEGRLRETVTFVIGRGKGGAGGELALTPRAKLAIELAVEEARALRHGYIGTEHLLIGLMNPKGENMALTLLERMDLSPERVREATLQAVQATDPASRGVSGAGAAAGGAVGGGGGSVPKSRGGLLVEVSRARDNVVTCRVDTQTLDALDALVEAGVYDTRSAAAARLIRAGLEANQPLLEKVFAAVAEIRRVREETQRLVRMWDGDAAGAEPPEGGGAEGGARL